jgi:hypothetical protein
MMFGHQFARHGHPGGVVGRAGRATEGLDSKITYGLASARCAAR